MTPEAHNEDRILDLLLQRSLEGLDEQEQAELATLLRRHPEVNPHQFDGVIAALDALPVDADVPPVPASLAANVLARIDGAQPVAAAPVPDAANDARFAWLVAAAASVVAVLGWFTALQDGSGPNASPTIAEGAMNPDAALRQSVDKDEEALILPFSSTDDPQGAGVSGAVHWSQDGQTGYMRFVGLEANDPLVEQYQLWIFDGTRDDKHPVDGGVFDIGADGEIVVPIAAKLLVRQPALFAITVEPPGGVVVSDRSRLILVAQAP